LEKNDINSALSFFTDDAVWTNPKGIFTGKQELKKYINWLFKTVSGMKFIDSGVGIIVQKNKGIYQHIFRCTIRGSRIQVPTFCTYLFNGKRCKIHNTIKATGFSSSKKNNILS